MKNIFNPFNWKTKNPETPPMTDEEIMTKVQECNSLEDMAKLVEKIWWIQWNKQFFTPQLFRHVINWVLDWTYPEIQITRTYGFRDRAMMILMAQRNKNTIPNSNITYDDCPELWDIDEEME